MFAIIVYLILGAFALLIIFAYIYYLKLANKKVKKTKLMKAHRRAYIRHQKKLKKLKDNNMHIGRGLRFKYLFGMSDTDSTFVDYDIYSEVSINNDDDIE